MLSHAQLVHGLDYATPTWHARAGSGGLVHFQVPTDPWYIFKCPRVIHFSCPPRVTGAFRMPAATRRSLPARRFIALVHTATTLLLSNGCDVKTLREPLGHSVPATTLRLYVHTSIANQKRAVAALDRVLPIAAAR